MTGKIYSQDLNIDLGKGREKELFRWFLACILFGKPIQEGVARQTYFEFIKAGLDSPEKILGAGWDKLVKILDQGHYVRYDYSTADKLLEICKNFKKEYGSVTNLIKSSDNLNDLKKRLEKFKGIGPVTSRIFIRDIKMIFNKIKKF
ncbi:DNA methylase [Candidatus Parcubacteria bacterium]|nr:DNA methylase [Candidatus Parcubacteria bacterium]